MATKSNSTDDEKNQLPEFDLFNINWEIKEVGEDKHAFVERAKGKQVRSVMFDAVSKFNDRVYYLKRDGATVARVDTMGTTQATYTPLIALAE